MRQRARRRLGDPGIREIQELRLADLAVPELAVAQQQFLEQRGLVLIEHTVHGLLEQRGPRALALVPPNTQRDADEGGPGRETHGRPTKSRS